MNKARKDKRNQSRIIGGEWRSRRFQFADQAALRPTPDRLRETLFNWIGNDIQSSRCLDLFAGSGALGLEALSRGATFATFVDSDPDSIRYINAAISDFDCHSRAGVNCADALRFLSGVNDNWDVVFIDPPFAAGLLPVVLEKLAASPLLSTGGWVFVEHPSNQPALETGSHWHLERSSKAGASTGTLLRRTTNSATLS